MKHWSIPPQAIAIASYNYIDMLFVFAWYFIHGFHSIIYHENPLRPQLRLMLQNLFPLAIFMHYGKVPGKLGISNLFNRSGNSQAKYKNILQK